MAHALNYIHNLLWSVLSSPWETKSKDGKCCNRSEEPEVRHVRTDAGRSWDWNGPSKEGGVGGSRVSAPSAVTQPSIVQNLRALSFSMILGPWNSTETQQPSGDYRAVFS